MSNPPTDYFVNPAIAANSGAGTVGDPYGDLQYALNTVTRNAADGDRFNVKAGTNEGLSVPLSLATYGSPAFSAPLIFQGYTTAQGDGGQGIIDCNANMVITNAGTGINWYDMEMYDGPAAGQILTLAQFSTLARSYIHDSDGYGVNVPTASSNSFIIGNHFEDLGDSTHDMLFMDTDKGCIRNNYFKQGGARVCRAAIRQDNHLGVISDNIISIDGASNAIELLGNYTHQITGNTILSGGGTGKGIAASGSNSLLTNAIINNYIEGFSGTGGVGFSLPDSSAGGGVYGQNAAYNNDTDYNVASEHYLALGDNEALGSSGLAKTGSDTYANRFAYFAPANSGNMQTGGYPEA